MLKCFNCVIILFFAALLMCPPVGSVENILRDDPIAFDEELIFPGLKLPPPWTQAADPDLVKLGNTWFMFFASMPAPDYNKIHILAASLPSGEGLDAPVSHWKIRTTDNGTVIPVISPSKDPQDWDFDTTETPKYVHGYDATKQQWVKRIYYTGWNRVAKGERRHYKIGFSEWNGQRWAKSAHNPVLTGTLDWEVFSGVTFIGDQTVFYEKGYGPNGEGGVWHLYYNAMANKPIPKGVIGHATSIDGVRWPVENREILETHVPFPSGANVSGPYHPDILEYNGRYYFTGWIINAGDLYKQGLWLTSSTTLDGSQEHDFQEWKPLIFENNGTYWHDSGLEDTRIHVTGLFGSTLKEENGQLWLFYHGVEKNTNKWGVASIGRARVYLE